jgi:hypothetical protein
MASDAPPAKSIELEHRISQLEQSLGEMKVRLTAMQAQLDHLWARLKRDVP